MTTSIISKKAYISLEYYLSVEDFLVIWNEMEQEGTPTQEDYDAFCLDYGKGYFYDMRAYIEDSIRLKEDN